MNYRRLSAISAGHFAIDVLNSSVAIILTSMVGRFDLSNSQIALGAMFYTFASSLTQPLFGLMADRVKGRGLAVGGLLWTMIFFMAASFAGSYGGMLGLLVIGALGSAAFHPVGAMSANHAGGARATSATSIFFLFGQTGLALGPVAAGIVLQRYGVAGLPWVAVALSPAVVMMALFLRQPIPAGEETAAPVHPPQTGARSGIKPAMQLGWLALAAFVALIALRSTTLQTFTFLLPKFLADQGLTSGEYGRMMGTFSLAGALGTLSGGFLADRFSRRQVIFASMLLGAPVSFLLLSATGVNYYLLAVTAGFLLNVPHSILVVMAQRLLPKRQGLASGAVMGFMFASGAAASGLAGWISDFSGLGVVLHVVALLPLLAGVCALTLPATRTPQLIPAPGPTLEGTAKP